MRSALGIVTTLVPLFALACGDGEDARLSELDGMDGFRDFSAKIERAIAEIDGQFFVERAVLQQETCPGDQEFGPCAGQPAGAVVTGIPSGVYQSDGGGFLQPEDFAQDLARYVGAALTEQTDAYGDSAVALYALARSEEEGRQVFHAITTSIVDTYPGGYPIGSVEREAHIFSFEFEDGRWRFTREGAAVVSLSSSDWLSGQCAECYVEWERWQPQP